MSRRNRTGKERSDGAPSWIALFQCKSKSLSTGRTDPIATLAAWIDIGGGDEDSPPS
jgi:hypothetical protein